MFTGPQMVTYWMPALCCHPHNLPVEGLYLRPGEFDFLGLLRYLLQYKVHSPDCQARSGRF